ncbi:MAG: flagellin, partial [Brevinematales bacterium]|nr:flagellin [Brevinematales bacterium]
LQRLRELSVQAGNGIYSDEDRTYMQVEVSQLIAEINRIASHAQFNGMNMLTGRFAPNVSNISFHIGANMDQRILINIGDMTAKGLNLFQEDGTNKINLLTQEGANRSIGAIDSALQIVNKQRADLGAYQNRLDKIAKTLLIGYENLQAAESRIRDTDMAYEMSDFVKNQILAQASVSMIAQANLRPQAIL